VEEGLKEAIPGCIQLENTLTRQRSGYWRFIVLVSPPEEESSTNPKMMLNAVE
jgi:hypothetical protein